MPLLEFGCFCIQNISSLILAICLFCTGTILSVESNTIKASEGVFGGNQLDPEASVSTEDKKNLRRMTQILRVYYIVGQSANEQIGKCLSRGYQAC